MTPELALTTLTQITHSFRTEEEPNFEAFLAVNEAIEQMMPQLDLPTAKILFEQLSVLGEIMQARYHSLETQISNIGPKRRAMKGYGHLRSHKDGQRIRKEV